MGHLAIWWATHTRSDISLLLLKLQSPRNTRITPASRAARRRKEREKTPKRLKHGMNGCLQPWKSRKLPTWSPHYQKVAVQYLLTIRYSGIKIPRALILRPNSRILVSWSPDTLWIGEFDNTIPRSYGNLVQKTASNLPTGRHAEGYLHLSHQENCSFIVCFSSQMHLPGLYRFSS